MSFLFRTDTIFYNAFYAVQEETSFLSYDDVLTFCALLNRKIRDTFGARNLCCNAIFDLNTSDDRFFNSNQNEFLRVDDGFLYYGGSITEQKLSLVNKCYEGAEVIKVLEGVRREYAELLVKKDEPILRSLQQESWQLTVV